MAQRFTFGSRNARPTIGCTVGVPLIYTNHPNHSKTQQNTPPSAPVIEPARIPESRTVQYISRYPRNYAHGFCFPARHHGVSALKPLMHIQTHTHAYEYSPRRDSLSPPPPRGAFEAAKLRATQFSPSKCRGAPALHITRSAILRDPGPVNLILYIYTHTTKLMLAFLGLDVTLAALI